MALDPNKKPRPPGKAGLAQDSSPTPLVISHPDEQVATALMRDRYVMERHFFLMKQIYVQYAMIAFLVVVAGSLAMRPIKHDFVATDSSGRLTSLVPLDKPIITQAELATWLTASVTQAYTFSFANYRKELSNARTNFTAAGWRGFEKALNDSGMLGAVIGNKYVTTAVPTDAPVLLTDGFIEGRLSWKFQVPILITYQSSSGGTTQSLVVTAVVARQSETDAARGLGIVSLVAQ